MTEQFKKQVSQAIEYYISELKQIYNISSIYNKTGTLLAKFSSDKVNYIWEKKITKIIDDYSELEETMIDVWSDIKKNYSEIPPKIRLADWKSELDKYKEEIRPHLDNLREIAKEASIHLQGTSFDKSLKFEYDFKLSNIENTSVEDLFNAGLKR